MGNCGACDSQRYCATHRPAPPGHPDYMKHRTTFVRTFDDQTLLRGARWLVAEVWWLVQEGKLNARSRAADAALDLRDTIDPSWWPEWEKENPKAKGKYDG